MLIYLAPIVALAGLIVYLATNNAKVSEVARILFFAGSFVTLLVFGGGK